MASRVRLFKIVPQNGAIDWVITNRHLDDDHLDDADGEAQTSPTVQDVQDENVLRWLIEQWHRELKLSGAAGAG